MKVPLGWLAEWVDLPDEAELCERLTLAGLEIEEILRSGPDLSAIRVGHVVERRQHPNADRLSLCRVDVGGPEPISVVCGAPNVAQGQKVAVALPGTTLPDGTEAQEVQDSRRGVGGHDLLGARARALRRARRHSRARPRAPRSARRCPKCMRAGETILDVEITPNRGDWVSMLGMAREIAALFGGELRLPACEPIEGARPAAQDVAIAIEAADGCARYVGRVVRGVRVGPSPDWLRARLESAGHALDQRTSSTRRTWCCTSSASRCTPSTSRPCAARRCACAARRKARSSRPSTARRARSPRPTS